MQIGRRGPFSLISIRIQSALSLSPEAIRQHTAEAYEAIAAELASSRTPHPIRFWNAIPGINDPAGPDRDRYMAFNAGRFEAFESWYGDHALFGESMATASGVGHDGDDLLIHCLASSVRGVPVENPRQIPSYRYSSRYGRLPPSFARATLLRGIDGSGPLLLVGGTASIRGEHSQHVSDLNEQVRETLRNLRALVHAAWKTAKTGSDCGTDWSSSFHSLRVYYRNEHDRSTVVSSLSEAFANVADIEWHRADLCRRELLVEIEGVAQIGKPMLPGLLEIEPLIVQTNHGASAANGTPSNQERS